MSDFTGEQKLRIVLESLLRDVPKKDQCKKYGISESEFDAWNDKLIKDGGTIYETSSQEKFPTSRSDTKSIGQNLVLIVSVLMNLLLVAGGIGLVFLF
jgi:transposase-like protein